MKKIILCLSTILLSTLHAHASVSLLEKDSWNIKMGGFVETDIINDSTRSLAETPGNTPVDRPDALAGQSGRTQFSIRNSRLSFEVNAPTVSDWKTKGYFEFDLLGFNPSPGTSGNTEAGLFNNSTFRARHIFLSAEHDGWQVLSGQTWGLLGWQPYYFIPTVQVSPLPGELYVRTTQAKMIKTMDVSGNTLQSAFGVFRPAQRDASFPTIEGGLRYAVNSRSGAFVGGSTGPQKTQPMSFGLSGLFQEIVIPQNTTVPSGDLSRLSAFAGAADILIPVLASCDGKDVSNTLTVGGEFTMGKGYGEEFTSWSGNQSSPLSSAATAPDKNVNLDAGIGGFDPNGLFHLVHLKTFNVYYQYHFSQETKTWISGGYSKLNSDNISSLTQLSGKTSAGKFPYDKQASVFQNIFHELSPQIRVGLEYAYFKTNYSDGVGSHNNRYQLSTWFIF